MRRCPEKDWKKVHDQFERMAPGMTTAVLLKICEEVVEEASEDPEPYKNVIEMFMRYIKQNANERLGRVPMSEMWVCRESMRLFQQYESDPTTDEARQLVAMADELAEELKKIGATPEPQSEHVALGGAFNSSLVN